MIEAQTPAIFVTCDNDKLIVTLPSIIITEYFSHNVRYTRPPAPINDQKRFVLFTLPISLPFTI